MANESIFNDQTLDVPCPEDCGATTTKPIGWLRANSIFPCAGCGVEVVINMEDFHNEMAEADGKIEDFIEKINKMD